MDQPREPEPAWWHRLSGPPRRAGKPVPPGSPAAAGSGSPAGRLRGDLLWNLGSFAFAAAAVAILNLLILRYYNRDALGVFAQVFSVYVLFSQFSALGVHFSVLQASAAHAADRRQCGQILAGALPLMLVLSVACAGVYWLARWPIANWLGSPGVARGIEASTLGLLLFGINKGLQGMVNGLEWMRSFALLQVARPVLMFAAFFVLVAAGAGGSDAAWVLTASEAGAFVLAAGLLAARGYFVRPTREAWAWMGRHLSFGVRSFGVGALTALSTRMDVLLLGYFWSDAEVGVYALPAMIAAGLYQVLVVLRNNLNPRIVRRWADGDRAGVESLAAQTRRRVYPLAAIAVLAILALYWPAAGLVKHGDVIRQGWGPLAVLLLGVWAVSGYLPFNQVLMLARRPAVQSGVVVLATAASLLANLALVPWLGAYGAAAATSFYQVFQNLLVVLLARRMLKLAL